jgi:hypothetical protein
MFTELIHVYSDITSEYVNKLCEQNSENIKVVANDTYRYLCRLILENIVLAPTNSVGKNKGVVKHQRLAL